MNTPDQSRIIQSPTRLHRITDIVFGVSMVLFIISGTLTFNDATFWAGYDTNPGAFVWEQARQLGTAFLVFLFMAIYWYTNASQSKYILRVDGTYTWINIFYLFFIAIAPFPNALSLQYGNDFYVQQFFNLDMFFIGLFGGIAWYYATKNRRLVVAELTESLIKGTNREMVVEPLVAVIAIVVSFINPSLWELALVLLPVGMTIVAIINRKRQLRKRWRKQFIA